MTITSSRLAPKGQRERVSEHLEVERKYDVSDSGLLMDLTAIPDVAAVEKLNDLTLDAVYFDTSSHALAKAGMTLRRRTGGADAGWTLKLPVAPNARRELRHPLGADQEPVPEALLGHVLAWTRHQPVDPVADVHTQRQTYRLFDVGGTALADAVDDRVTSRSGTDLAAAELKRWREWEIELIDGPVELLEAADEIALRAGATRSAWSSKLARALGDQAAAQRDSRPSHLTARSPAGVVVLAHLAEQIGIILAEDGAVRAKDGDSVHNMRVAIRHLRSVLKTFRPLFRRDITDAIRAELSWLGTALGAARDADVQRVHLLELVAAEPGDLVMGPVAARIEVELRTDERAAADELAVVLNSPRYFALLNSLDSLIDAPPFSGRADKPAYPALTRLVRKSWKRVQTLATAKARADTAERDRQLHDTRKAAKSLRYACEAVRPAFKRPATRLARVAEVWQTLLGDHQDSVVARQTLRSLGARMFLDGQNSFTIGRMHALEQARGQRAAEDFTRAWEVGSRPKLRIWLND